MYMCMYMYMHMHMHACTCTCTCSDHTQISFYIHTCTYTYTCTYTCTYMYIHTCTYIHVHTYMYIHVHVHTCTYIHVHVSSFSNHWLKTSIYAPTRWNSILVWMYWPTTQRELLTVNTVELAYYGTCSIIKQLSLTWIRSEHTFYGPCTFLMCTCFGSDIDTQSFQYVVSGKLGKCWRLHELGELHF